MASGISNCHCASGPNAGYMDSPENVSYGTLSVDACVYDAMDTCELARGHLLSCSDYRDGETPASLRIECQNSRRLPRT